MSYPLGYTAYDKYLKLVGCLIVDGQYAGSLHFCDLRCPIKESNPRTSTVTPTVYNRLGGTGGTIATSHLYA